jgi:hypothetical protein
VTFDQRKVLEEKISTDSSFNGAIVRSFALAPPNLLICKEAYSFIPLIILTRKNFYLLDSINDKIEMLKTSGIINYWYFKPLKKKILANNSPKVLNLQSFIGSFQLFVFGHFLSAFIFVGEIVSKFIVKHSQARATKTLKLNFKMNYAT